MSELRILQKWLKENPSECAEICRQANLSKSSLKRKLYNPKKFTIYEILVIRRIAGLTMDETIKIFAPFVAKHN